MLLVNKSTNTLISDQVRVAGSFYRRLRGLIGRKHFARGSALVLEPCRQVHTFFMRFPLDVIFLDEQGLVLVVLVMPPGRVSPYIRRARRVVELPAGTAAANGIAKNHILQLIERRVGNDKITIKEPVDNIQNCLQPGLVDIFSDARAWL